MLGCKASLGPEIFVHYQTFQGVLVGGPERNMKLFGGPHRFPLINRMVKVTVMATKEYCKADDDDVVDDFEVKVMMMMMMMT